MIKIMQMERLPFLPPPVVKTLLEDLYRCRPQWLEINDGYGRNYQLFGAHFPTLEVPPETIPVTQKRNDFLWEHFGWIYPLLKEICEDTLGIRITYAEERPLPGFVIHPFRPQGEAKRNVSDLPYHVDALGTLPPVFDPLLDRVCAVTLPLQGPKGLGLDYLDAHYSKDRFRDREDYLAKIDNFKQRRVLYRPGELILQDGMRWHRPRGFPSSELEKDRVVLQGFVFAVNGEYVLAR